MKKTAIYILLLVLAACAADVVQEPESPVDYDGAKIVVMGGSATSGGTRAATDFPEPSNFGVCNANKLRILQFREAKTGGIEANDLKQLNFYINDKEKSYLDLDLLNQLNYRDKWTNYTVTLNIKGSNRGYYTGYAFPAIAYTDTDEVAFVLPDKSDYDYTAASLNVKDPSYTPELYFGRLKPINISANINYDLFEQKGFIYQYRGANTNSLTEDCQLEGKLYRIVSQLNVNISDINENVQKLEMFLSNVPIRVSLYETHRTDITKQGDDHGYFYPVMAATDTLVNMYHHCMETTKVYSASEFKDGAARLSTFLLPSTQGRTVTIEATIRKPYLVKDPNTENNTNGEKYITEYKDTVISRTLIAGKNYNLDLATSRVYYSETELPVYKAATNEFMSYSNVRVNVSGKFSDIFSEQSEPNVVIEICPNYEGQHEITIN